LRPVLCATASYHAFIGGSELESLMERSHDG
jgi:hypothetical protein